MELLPIGSDKLKVTLTEADMESYRLSADTLNWDDTGTRKALWSILDEAKKQCGFDAAREQILVQIFPSRAGGCEMFVTRTGERRRGANHESVRTAIKKSDARACVFDRLYYMIAFCAVLRDSGYKDPADAYSLDDGRFLLIYYKDDPRAAEFGRITPLSDMEFYIGEHTEIICQTDAVTRLAALI
ncbi:MAG: adaptor protein MecA [Clostridia bacterium]|nr:adaptor protein MecA [Clostridia bacterium]